MYLSGDARVHICAWEWTIPVAVSPRSALSTRPTVAVAIAAASALLVSASTVTVTATVATTTSVVAIRATWRSWLPAQTTWRDLIVRAYAGEVRGDYPHQDFIATRIGGQYLDFYLVARASQLLQRQVYRFLNGACLDINLSQLLPSLTYPAD